MLSIAEQAIMKGVTAVCRMRNSFSAAGGARLCSPLQGSLSKRQSPAKPPLQGEVPPQAAEGCGACPHQYPSGRRKPSGGRERPPYNVRQACSTAGDDKPPDSGRSSVAARSRPQCRAGDFARRMGFAAWQGSGTLQASSPTDARQGTAKLYRVSPP